MTIYINYVFFDKQKMNENSLVKKKMSVICGEAKTAAYHREYSSFLPARSVLRIREHIVIGPTPPGTGLI